GCDDDAVERRHRFPSLNAIAMFEAHVLQLEIFRARFRTFDERGDALHAVDAAHEWCKHCGLVSTARAHFENSFDSAELEKRFGHARNDVRLRDRLAETDGQC